MFDVEVTADPSAVDVYALSVPKGATPTVNALFSTAKTFGASLEGPVPAASKLPLFLAGLAGVVVGVVGCKVVGHR